MGYRAYRGHAGLDLDNIRAFAICERCGQLWNHDRLAWQHEYRGPSLVNTGKLVCPGCLDDPNPSMRTIVLPADPVPVINPRVPNPADLITHITCDDSWLTCDSTVITVDNV